MKKLLPILLLISSCSTQSDKTKSIQADTTKVVKSLKPKVISDPTNKLTGKTENLEVEYVVFGCACANWIRSKDNYNTDTTKKFEDLYFYIEPAEKSLEVPLYFDAYRHRLKITGQFYERPDYPQGTVEMEEHLDKARVFRYTAMKVIDNPNFKPDSKIETLTLSYNAISCTCAQWSESKFDKNLDNRIRYWLEPSNENLIKADTLYNGENLPVQIKVTGQIVSETGFPKGDLSKVGQEEAGKVFRYTKIKVLKNGQRKNGY